MGKIQKIGSDYFIEFLARGLKYQQKIGPSRALAVKALKETEEKISRGEAATVVRDIHWTVFLDDFLVGIKKDFSPKTFQRFRSLVRNFKVFLKQDRPDIARLSELTPRVIEDFRSFLDKANKPDVNLNIFLLREVFDHAIKLGYLNDNPTLHVRILPANKKEIPVILSEREAEQFLRYASPLLKLTVEIILATGLSLEELAQLGWNNIDWTRNCISILFKKKAQARTIFLVAQAKEKLKDHRKDQSNSRKVFPTLSKKKLQSELEDIAKQIAFPSSVNFEIFQNTFAAHLMRRGISLTSLQKILGKNDVAQVFAFTAFIEKDVYSGAHHIKS